MGILGQLHPADLCVQRPGFPVHPSVPRVTYSRSPSKKRGCKRLRRCNLCCQLCATFLTVVSKFLAAARSLMWLTPVTVSLLSVSSERILCVQCKSPDPFQVGLLLLF